MRNPAWNRDELILALDLYFDERNGLITNSTVKYKELSQTLQKIASITNDVNDKFRNVNGVALKIANFKAIDPNHTGKGMARGGQLDKSIFQEFINDQVQLKKIANQIKAVLKESKHVQYIININDDENTINDSVKEGQILYKLHKVRERNKKITAAKKSYVLSKHGKLDCEVCVFNFENRYDELGAGFIECHHIISLSSSELLKETRLDDLALVCSNCHRIIHRGETKTIEQMKNSLKPTFN